MSICEYSLRRDSARQLSPSFKVREFGCKGSDVVLLDEELVVKTAKKTGRVFTVEEHSIIGGLGAAVAETLGEKCPTKITRIGVNDVFGESGPAKELLHKYELDAEGIANRILREMK